MQIDDQEGPVGHEGAGREQPATVDHAAQQDLSEAEPLLSPAEIG